MASSPMVAGPDEIVSLDRRRADRRQACPTLETGTTTGSQSAKKYRRRHIDPTTCERDYRQDELDFMRAIDDYKRSAGRMFPTCSEVLEVVRSLGYVRLNDEQLELLGDSIVEETAFDPENNDTDVWPETDSED